MRVLIVGHGHAGGSVAEVGARAGLDVTVWGRRSKPELSRAFRELVLEQYPAVAYEQVDTSAGATTVGATELTERFRAFDWVVLANEARPQIAEAAEIERNIAGVGAIYRQLRDAGFLIGSATAGVAKTVVRIGSPAAERPHSTIRPDVAQLPYFENKRRLCQLAEREFASGLAVLTVAPAEIHSPFGTYGDSDPYRMGLAQLDSMPVVHDLPGASVSDHSVGEAVLVAAGLGSMGSWYQVADAPIGPGAALIRMAEHLGRPTPPVAVWSPRAASHMLDVLHGTAPMDLDQLMVETDGLDHLLSPARAIIEAQQTVAANVLWWAGAPAQERARQAAATVGIRLASEILRHSSRQLAPRMLAILLAMGTDRADPALAELVSRARAEFPQLELAPESSESARIVRLALALERQAAYSGSDLSLG